jgi:hypothetical protein
MEGPLSREEFLIRLAQQGLYRPSVLSEDVQTVTHKYLVTDRSHKVVVIPSLVVPSSESKDTGLRLDDGKTCMNDVVALT